MVTPRSGASDTYVARIGVAADIASLIAATLTADLALPRFTKAMLRSKKLTGIGRRQELKNFQLKHHEH